MNKQILSLLLTCIVASIIIESCSKASNSSATATTPPASLNEIMASLRPIPENLSVTAGRDTVVYGADSTLLHFYANSFENASGIITSGIVNLQLTEVYKPGDFVLNRVTTMVNTSFLSCYGAIKLVATMNGATVSANKYGVGFKQPGTLSVPLQLYFGNTTNADTVTEWAQGSNTTGTTATTTTDSVDNQHNNSLYFNFDSCSAFNWVCCGALYTSSLSLVNISVALPSSSYSNSYTEVFLLFPAIKACVPVDVYNGNTYTFSLANEVPSGLAYELAVVTADGTWYYYEQSGVTVSGLAITATPSQATWTGLVTTVEAL